MYFEGNLTMHYFALLSEKYYCFATFHAGKWLKTALFQANTLSFGIVVYEAGYITKPKGL
jgi:hypothetical protein